MAIRSCNKYFNQLLTLLYANLKWIKASQNILVKFDFNARPNLPKN